jgi:ATP-binding cassette, subfamily C, type I secretion system permease/ATPase
MRNRDQQRDPGPWRALMAQRGLLAAVLVFGGFVNVLVLTGPIFALQVYDRVLGSRSVETLVVLTVLMAFLFVVMGVLDHVRKRIAARIGERMGSVLEGPVLRAAFAQRGAPSSADCLTDLETIRRFFASALVIALLDLPWVPLFLVGIAMFHPTLGLLAGVGAALFLLPGLATLAIGADISTSTQQAARATRERTALALQTPDIARSLGAVGAISDTCRIGMAPSRTQALKVADKRAVLASVAQTFRLFLQSAVVAMAAYLILQNQLRAGAIIATIVLLGRALGPLDMIGQNVVQLRGQMAAWRRLSHLLASNRSAGKTQFSLAPGDGVQISQITVFPSAARRAALRMVSFDVKPGQAVGVTGPSGAGKTVLARAIAGLLPAAGGQIRFGGVPLDQICADDLARHVGYLAQDARLLDGSIADNICRFSPEPDRNMIIKAASDAGAHDRILALSGGYDTKVDALPGGLAQQVALARAMFGCPQLLVLDEPANNLDGAAFKALHETITAATGSGRTVILFSQRPAVLTICDRVLVLQNGTQKDFAPPGRILTPPRVAEQRRFPANLRSGSQ